MKKSIFFLVFAFLVSMSGYSQCEGDCINADMNFTPEQNYNNAHPDWQTSHGSPSVNTGSIWMWSANGVGEGINYQSYNFVAGKEYCISFEATTVVRGGGLANPGAYFRVAATQGNVMGVYTPGGGAPLPALTSPSDVIANENWNGTSPPSTSVYTYTFTASDNFDNLWIHPFSPTMPVVELTLRNLRICEVPDPCDEIGFSLQLNEHGSGATAVSLLPTGIPAGSTSEMSITKDGINVYSGPFISYLAMPGNYTFCLRVSLPDGTRCTKCFDFCIGEWSDRNNNVDEEKSSIISTKRKLDTLFEFPDELKEKNIESSLLEDSIRVFPNPTSGKFRIEVDKNIEIASVQVYNVALGRSVGKLDIKENNIQVDISKEVTGVYNVAIELVNGSVIHEKIILKK